MSAPAEPASRRPAVRLGDPAARLLGLLDRPLTSYYLILGCTLLLLGLGLAMVLSTSSGLRAGPPPAHLQPRSRSSCWAGWAAWR